jgi:ComF family protein
MKNWFSDLLNIFYPKVCMGCSTSLYDGENVLCIGCAGSIPVAYELLESDEKVKDLFYGRLDLHHARSLFFYEKIGVVQHMIHQLKYQQQQHVSAYLGKWTAGYVTEDALFSDVDYVVPVPVHAKRFKQRGYNQVTLFGQEISDALGVRFRENVLTKTKNTIKQAQLGQVKRIDERESPYELQEQLPAGSHILLVDDVITTGTTLSLCAKELLKIPDVKISILTMAVSV